MHPVRALAKNTARGLVIDGTAFGGRGAALTAQDVAAALGMGTLDDPAALALLTKFCGDNRATDMLQSWLSAWIGAECERLQLKQAHCGRLAGVALFEFSWGAGARLSARERSLLTMGDHGKPIIGKSQMAACWGTVIDAAIAELLHLEADGLRHLRRQLDDAA